MGRRMVIETERLILKSYTLDDLNNYHLLMSNALVWEYSTNIPHENIAELRQKLEQTIEGYANNSLGFHALFDKNDGIFIGEAGILSWNKNADRCVIGYNLLPDFWGMGYATEISEALIKHAFDELHARRVEALAQKANIASCRVLEKSGMTLEGVLRNFMKKHGNYYDVCYYSIISGEYHT